MCVLNMSITVYEMDCHVWGYHARLEFSYNPQTDIADCNGFRYGYYSRTPRGACTCTPYSRHVAGVRCIGEYARVCTGVVCISILTEYAGWCKQVYDTIRILSESVLRFWCMWCSVQQIYTQVIKKYYKGNETQR